MSREYVYFLSHPPHRLTLQVRLPLQLRLPLQPPLHLWVNTTREVSPKEEKLLSKPAANLASLPYTSPYDTYVTWGVYTAAVILEYDT